MKKVTITNKRPTIRPHEDDSMEWNFLIETLWGHVVDEFLTDTKDEADRLVGANLAEGYAVRITRAWGIPVDVYLPESYGMGQLPPTDPTLLARLKPHPGADID